MPSRIRTSDLTILVVSGIAVAALTAISFALAPADSLPRTAGSSFSIDPAGGRAAFLVLQELGHDLRRSYEPIASIRSDPSSTLLILANPQERPSTGDQRALQRFVREGGTVVAFGLAAAAFLPGVTADAQRPRDQPLEVFQAALPGPLTRGARELSAHRIPSPALDPAYAPVYGSRDNVAVVIAKFGDGQVVWCLDATLAQNDGIVRATNVRFISNAAGLPGARTILWDEYYHGERRSFWSYVTDTPLVYAGAQLGLVMLAILAGTSRRRGPLRARVVEPRTSPLEFIDTMAALYERADNARAAVEGTRDRLRRRLAMTSGTPTSSSDDTLASLAAPRLGLDPERVRSALAAAADLLHRDIRNGKVVVPLVAELQQLIVGTEHRGLNSEQRAPSTKHQALGTEH